MATQKALGIGIPFMLPNTGRFNSTYTTLKTIKSNIYIILSTRIGERYFEPDFGFNCDDLLFEQIDNETLSTLLEQRISDCIYKYIDNVTIQSVEIIDYDTTVDNNTLEFTVSFSLSNDTNNVETVTINYQTN